MQIVHRMALCDPLRSSRAPERCRSNWAKLSFGISRRLGSSLRFLRSFQLPTVRPFSASGFTMSRVSVDVMVVLRAPPRWRRTPAPIVEARARWTLANLGAFTFPMHPPQLIERRHLRRTGQVGHLIRRLQLRSRQKYARRRTRFGVEARAAAQFG